ncbi:Sec-independent protein translocase protein TatB [Parvibaculum sp.]|uniref:Sec-independent protein translocase protein TatB n=1 Tax=Parvibaculum sp. TaxID=2024848 RepID=UPI0027227764|nr:Sec-independent protein translocase protein TatB [Parvibaculum sp.]MDO9127458.1 Sec-independent protein translocase protein TatB [Parvibaculum sp.]MDP1628131.1 Sec-independent protein translocase protein TatB [Parvibaculum sp.]MDP2151130.1 Sec-independent protein translocase protein TatB [Parvibaculum sp.]MDP3328159.1 Sec-independent protein translocase protein TatB [Parvibaculum sp.]
MFDIGWSELLALAAIAIIFVGPKDLPRMMRTIGQYVAKARAMAREFQTSFEDLARETELEELRKEVTGLRNQAVAPLRSLQQEMNKPLAIGGGGAGAAAAAASAARAEEEKRAALDTSGLSPEMAEAVREAEAVEAYGASDPANAGEAAAPPKRDEV